jgi:hydroxyacylglutathione hydrolase
VVDPQRDVEQYLDDAARLDCRIAHVFLTHFHADFVAGHLELRERTGASIHLGARAEAEYPFVAMADGAVVELGSVRLKVCTAPVRCAARASRARRSRRSGSSVPTTTRWRR